MEEETQNNVIDNDDNSTVETAAEEETIEKETEVAAYIKKLDETKSVSFYQ